MIYLISVVILLMLLFTEWAYTLSTKKKKKKKKKRDALYTISFDVAKFTVLSAALPVPLCFGYVQPHSDRFQY